MRSIRGDGDDARDHETVGDTFLDRRFARWRRRLDALSCDFGASVTTAGSRRGIAYCDGGPMLVFHMIPGAPDPVAPFSHAVEADGWVFVTGQMPFVDTSMEMPYPDGIEAQTHQVMKNLATVLAGCGLGLPDVVSVRIFLTRFDADYDAMNAAYAGYFAADRRPARTCVGVNGLAKGALIEIDLIARRPAT